MFADFEALLLLAIENTKPAVGSIGKADQAYSLKTPDRRNADARRFGQRADRLEQAVALLQTYQTSRLATLSALS